MPAFGLLSRGAAAPRVGLENLPTAAGMLADTSGDGVADAIRARLVVSEDGTGLPAAAAVLERLCFESAGMDFNLVTMDTGFQPAPGIFPVIIGRANRHLPESIRRAVPAGIAALPSWAGVVCGQLAGQPALFIFGSDAPAECYAARSFFGRWPYLWDIWGRRTGLTFDTLRKDARKFLQDHAIRSGPVSVRAAWYANKSAFDQEREDAANLAREMSDFVLDAGEITRLELEMELAGADLRPAADAFLQLVAGRERGQGTEVLNYPGVSLLDLRLVSPGETATRLIPRYSLPARFLSRRFQPAEGPAAKGPLWLDDLYAPGGFYGDMNDDRIPDDLLFQLVAGGDGWTPELLQLAGRLALETTGARFPIARHDSELADSPRAGSMIIVGQENRQFRRLLELGLTGLDSPPETQLGRGNGDPPAPLPDLAGIAAVNHPAAGGPHLVISGGTAVARSAAVAWLARCYPYLDLQRDEEATVGTLLQAVRRSLEGNSPEAALAMMAAEKTPLLRLLAAAPGIRVRAEARVNLPGAGDAEILGKAASALFPRQTDFRLTNRLEPKIAFQLKRELPWEWETVLADVRNYLDANPSETNLELDIRVSEPAAVRARLGAELKELLAKSYPGRVASFRLLSAYKQGYSWLVEEVSPRLRPLSPTALEVEFAPCPAGTESQRKVYGESVRWLEELYPVDEILARDLGLPVAAIRFREAGELPGGAIYRLTALDRRDRPIFRETFSPLREERPFFNRFPSWGAGPVCLAGFRVTRRGEALFQKMEETDLSRVWRVFQEEVLPELEKEVMKKTGNRPTLDQQPFFQRLVMELAASEPDERIGLDEEHLSSLESIHEDFYFLTLEYLNQLLIKDDAKAAESVHYARANPFGAPGNVLPLVRPGPPGKGPVVEFRLEVPQSNSPSLELFYTSLEGVEHPEKVKLEPFSIQSLHCEALYVSDARTLAGARLRLQLKEDGQYEKFSRFIPVWQRLIRGGGASSPGRFPLEFLEFHLVTANREGSFRLDTGMPGKRPADPAVALDKTPPAIRTDRIVSPEECAAIMQRFAGQPGFRVFRAGTSYENRPVFAAEITAPSTSELVSRTKLLLRKPTIMLTGRQHANEVASTGYLLKLMELLGTDPKWSRYLNTLNFVVHPLENPDGAAIACRLQELTPDHALHAGRFSSLGIDLGYEVDKPDTLLTEALVRDALYRRWLPDIYLNLHGYPSHEWVQQFSGYTPYLFRQYWIPKGWFAYFRADDSGLEPEYERAAGTLLGYISRAMESDLSIAGSNRKFYDRYRRWAVRWQPHLHYLDQVDQTGIYHTRRSGKATRLDERGRLTFAEGIPEGMDETARGEFLAFVSREGLRYVQAHLDYLSAAVPGIVPVEEEKNRQTLFQVFRRRPVQPEPDTPPATESKK